MGLLTMAEKKQWKHLGDSDEGYLRWRVSCYECSSINSKMENHYMVAEQKRVEHKKRIQHMRQGGSTNLFSTAE